MQEINLTAQFDLDEIGSHVAPYISPSVIAQEIDTDAIAESLPIRDITREVADMVAYDIDLYEVAQNLDYSDLAQYVSVDEIVEILRGDNEDMVGGKNEVLVSRVASLEARVKQLEDSIQKMVNAMQTASSLMGFCRSVELQTGWVVTDTTNTEPF